VAQYCRAGNYGKKLLWKAKEMFYISAKNVIFKNHNTSDVQYCRNNVYVNRTHIKIQEKYVKRLSENRTKVMKSNR